MKKYICLFICLCVLNSNSLFCQNKVGIYDTVINLPEITVYPFSKSRVLEPAVKRPEIDVSASIQSAIVSKINLKVNEKYKIKAIEFFFNPIKKGFTNEGFVIKPLMMIFENDKLGPNKLDGTTYFVDRSKKARNLFDVRSQNIVFENTKCIYVGFEFVNSKRNTIEMFNAVMIASKKLKGYSLVKKSCPNCVNSELDLDENRGLCLKYKIYYTN